MKHPAPVNGVDFSLVAPVFATGTDDGVVRLWEVPSYILVRSIPAHIGPANVVRFSPSLPLLASGGDDGFVRMWRLGDSNLVAEPLAFGIPIQDLRFSAVTNRLFVRTAGDRVQAFGWTHPVATLRVTNSLPVAGNLEAVTTVLGVSWTNFHAAEITFTTVSSDGRLIATASADRTARTWNIATGRAVTEPLIHSAVVNSVVFSPDGLRVATSTSSRRIRVWDVEKGLPLTDELETAEPVSAVAFSSDGTRVIASTGESFPIHVGGHRRMAWLADLAEGVAGFRLNGQGVREPIAHLEAAGTCARLLHELPR